MKEITVLSGKGGTGKTSITSSLAAAGRSLVLCDGDVDAADLHLVLNPELLEKHVFEGSWKVTIDPLECTLCGICTELCRFEAIETMEDSSLGIDPFKCEGCRLCERICPSAAISSERSCNNHWMVSRTENGIMVHAQMGPGEENSGKLVTQVRKVARELALKEKAEIILTDGPPGIGCPVIASVTGTDLVLLVLEPTLSSLHDAARLVELVRSFKIPVGAIINKHDLHPETTVQLEEFLSSQRIPVLAKLPFDEDVVRAMVQGKPVVEYAPESVFSRAICSVWDQLLTREEEFIS